MNVKEYVNLLFIGPFCKQATELYMAETVVQEISLFYYGITQFSTLSFSFLKKKKVSRKRENQHSTGMFSKFCKDFMGIMVWIQCIKSSTQSLHVNIRFKKKKKRHGFCCTCFIEIRQHGCQVLNTMLACYISLNFRSLKKQNKTQPCNFFSNTWTGCSLINPVMWGSHQILEIVTINFIPLFHWLGVQPSKSSKCLC